MPLTTPRRRSIAAFATVLLATATLVIPLVVIAAAQGSPTVSLVNPSDYTRHGQVEQDPRPAQISDRKTGTDEADDEQEDTYRLVAVAGNVPQDASLEFEIAQGPLNVTIGLAERVAPDTFEFNWDVSASGLPDGQYTLRALLYSGTDVTAIEVARDERPVIIFAGAQTAAPTVDFDYGLDGQPAGFYTHPITGATNILVDLEWSAGTTWLYVLYTLSDPGDEPAWKECALEPVGFEGSASPAGSGRFMCVLESADQGGASVTGLAALANDTNEPFGCCPDPNFNRSGDAIRILPYAQDPTSMTIDRDTVRSDTTTGAFPCSPAQFVSILDQNLRPIGGANVDVHATGPSDQLKFWHGVRTGAPASQQPPSRTNYQPPDKGHGSEQARVCAGLVANTAQEQAQFARRQGEHNRPILPDIKHIETAGGGTSGSGNWGIQMWSDRAGETQLTFFADEDDDDQYCSEEVSVPAGIGWNQNAPVPVLETPQLTICPVPVPPPPGSTLSPSVSPSGSTSSPPDSRGCTINGTSGNDEITGTDEDDVICGNGGDDEIQGGDGNDTIYGDEGDDTLRGGAGNDSLEGSFGDDVVLGDQGNDLVDGSEDNDVAFGGAGNDTIRGEAGVDSLSGNGGRDVIQGGSLDDVLAGGGGNDILKGWNGQDILRGGSQDDILRGGKQNDRLNGGSGNDTLQGGPGRDQCRDGAGRDRVRSCEG